MLWQYLTDEREAGLALAYELGRVAIARGLGVLDMASIHSQMIEDSLPLASGKDDRATLKAAGAVLLEALSPFEATHRGFRETNRQFRKLIATLEVRNRELVDINRKLAAEINERKRTARALRASEEHYRRLFNETREMQERLRNLSHHVLRAQEAERRRISRELHDEVGRAMTAISVNLEMLKPNRAGTAAFRQNVAAIHARLVETMETIHGFARELRPALLDELGLLPALRSYLHAFADRTGVQVRFQASAHAEQLNDDLKTVLYRVAQESLTNVAKHAQASRVEVTIRKHQHGICMEVADDGKSFREDHLKSAKGPNQLGLLGMQERVRLVNGRFDIRGEPGRGTTVRVLIPFKTAAAAPLRKQVRRRTEAFQTPRARD